MKKIGVVAHWGYASLHGGNLRSFFFIREMIKKNYDVTLILTTQSEVDYCTKKFRCKTLLLKNTNLTRWDSIFIKILKYIKFIFSCHFLLRKENFDAVYGINLIQTLPIIFLPSKIKKWIIFVDLWADFFFYNTYEKIYNYPLMKIIRFFEFLSAKKSSKTIVISSKMKSFFPTNCHNKIKVIPDGADLERFGIQHKDRSYLLKKFNIPKKNFIISYQGGISRHEGLHLLCEAAKNLYDKGYKEVSYLIVGKGEHLEFCKKLIINHNVSKNFIFTGWINHDEMPKIVSSIDLSVVPMPNVRAAQPIISFKLLEGIASGVKIISNRIPAILELLKNEDFVSFTNAENADQFSNDIIQIILNKDNQIDIKKKSIDFIKNYDWKIIAKKDLNYFETSL